MRWSCRVRQGRRAALTSRAKLAVCVYSARGAALCGVCWPRRPGAGLASGADVLGSCSRRTPATTPRNGFTVQNLLLALRRFAFWLRKPRSHRMVAFIYFSLDHFGRAAPAGSTKWGTSFFFCGVLQFLKYAVCGLLGSSYAVNVDDVRRDELVLARSHWISAEDLSFGEWSLLQVGPLPRVLQAAAPVRRAVPSSGAGDREAPGTHRGYPMTGGWLFSMSVQWPFGSIIRTGRHETARYGLRAQRVGEASHPGPAAARRRESEADEAECALRSEACRARGWDHAGFRCSKLTCPLAWAAARQDYDNPVLARLCSLAPQGVAAVARTAFRALVTVLIGAGIHNEANLSVLLSGNGNWGRVSAGEYFGEECQRWFLNWAIRQNGVISGLEDSYVATVEALSAGDRDEAASAGRAPQRPRGNGNEPRLVAPSALFPSAGPARVLAPAPSGPGLEWAPPPRVLAPAPMPASRATDMEASTAETSVRLGPMPMPPRNAGADRDASSDVESAGQASTDDDMSEHSDRPEPANDEHEVDSQGAHSEYGGPDVDEDRPASQQSQDQQIPCASTTTDLRGAFQSLDEVNLQEIFSRRACLLKGVPGFLRGPLRAAFRISMEEARRAKRANDDIGRGRAWKLFDLTSRMLLHRPPGERCLPKEEFTERFEKFAAGRWLELLEASRAPARRGVPARRASEEQRAARAEALVFLGELSSARQALESAELAPGTPATLAALKDEERRPERPRDDLPPEVQAFRPRRRFKLEQKKLLRNLRGARKGAAAGPSGVTADHLKVLLEDEATSNLFCEMCQELAEADVPREAIAAKCLGRLTALQKSNGGVRGIVAGDIVRRLVSRTIAQQIGPEVEEATSPHQYALSTRAGTECVAHALQALTAQDERMTVLSIDGVGAFDSISRAAMLSALSQLPGASATLPFVKMWYGQPSNYLWEDDEGQAHRIPQGEGGEQGDALMPLLYALGQHGALEAIKSRLLPGERLFAFLDDLYVAAMPERIVEIYGILEQELWRHARIRINGGKTQVWNRGGARPAGVESLGRRAWRGEGTGPLERQGVTILGTPLGTPEFVRSSLRKVCEEQRLLLQRIPGIQDTQAAWLELLYCAASRANYVTRVVAPELSEEFARAHDDGIWECFSEILGVHPEDVAQVWRGIAQLPFHSGGLGLRSADRLRAAAHWASWADSLPMIQARHPDIAVQIRDALASGGGGSQVLTAVARCEQQIAAAGMRMPTWESLIAGARPEPPPDGSTEPGIFQHGWQFYAAKALDEQWRESLLPRLSRPDRAHLRSQSGPGSGAAFAAVPTSDLLRIEPQPFRTLLLRRLRMPLPSAGSSCRCRHPLGPLGDHRAA